MADLYKVEVFGTSAVEALDPDGASEFEDRLNELASDGWKVVALTSDKDGYVVILQQTRRVTARPATVL
jgi:hypothetical protein